MTTKITTCPCCDYRTPPEPIVHDTYDIYLDESVPPPVAYRYVIETASGDIESEHSGVTGARWHMGVLDARAGRSVAGEYRLARIGEDGSRYDCVCSWEYTDEYAEECDGIQTVVDPTGGRWWPSDEAQEEIAASADPESTAVRICREDPTRGEWRA